MYKYITYLPKKHNKAQQYPLLIFLHGAPQRGDNFEKLKQVALPFEIEKNNLKIDMIVVAPLCPITDTWEPEKIYQVFVDVYKNYPIDLKKIYLTGFSMGGFGAIKFAKEYSKLLAAIAPVCSGGSKYVAPEIKDIPFWFFHGKQDKIIGYEKTEELFKELQKLNADVKLTTYEDLGHEIWNETYKNEELYQWFLSHHL